MFHMKHFKKGEIKKRKKEMEKKGMFHVKHFRKRKIKKKEEDGEERNVSCETF